MYRQIKLCLAFIAPLVFSSLAIAETSVSGYVSLVGGKVFDGDLFLADYPKSGIYDSDWSFTPDTSIGVQLITDLNNEIDLVVQAISNGASDYDINIDWAYLSYPINPELSIQAGRKRLPLYYYSDFFDLGYAYYWIRPPADNYTWQISNYNGLSIEYQPYQGDWDTLFSIYIGREDSKNNELLSLLFAQPVDETWKNMIGVVTELSKDFIEFRATYMSSELDRTINGVITEQNVRQVFSGLSINLYYYDFIFLSEYNHYHRVASDIHVDTNMVSLAYEYKKFTPHITRSTFQQKANLAGGDEDHSTTSIGLRWYVNDSTSLKIQIDKVDDEGIIIPVVGDSKVISMGIDIVF